MFSSIFPSYVDLRVQFVGQLGACARASQSNASLKHWRIPLPEIATKCALRVGFLRARMGSLEERIRTS